MIKMTGQEMYCVVQNCLGEIEPCGDSNIDAKRTKHLDEWIYLTSLMVDEISDIIKYIDRHEASMHEIGKKALDCIRKINEDTKYCMWGYEDD